MYDTDVTIDFCTISEGINVCGIDGHHVSQLSDPEPITHCREKKQETAAYTLEMTFLFFCKAKLFSIYHLLMYFIHFSL